MTALAAADYSALWNHALIERYDLSGPRYTSYPTAPHFHPQFDLLDYQAAAMRSNASGSPLSLYFHIPYCSTVCYYCACNKIITANRKRVEPYLAALLREIELKSAIIDSSRPVKQLHWGGGTPTYINDDQKRTLMAAIRKHFNLVADDEGEFSIEIHPGETSVATLHCLREIGFNRLSMGVQDFDPRVQRAVNRCNSYEQVEELVTRSRQLGFHSISMDLIYGLPYQSWESFSRTLKQIIALSPDRLSVFNYAHLPAQFKVQRQIDSLALPTAAEKLRILQLTTTCLLEAGYQYIGMDHFAKPEDELSIAQRDGNLHRNFQGYATHGNCELVGFGVSSISEFGSTFNQNHKTESDYLQALAAGRLPLARGLVLTDDDLIRQQVIKRLICDFELKFAAIEQHFDINFCSYFASELEALMPLAEDGLLVVENDKISVTSQGRLLIRRICMQFDAYLEMQKPQAFSKII